MYILQTTTGIGHFPVTVIFWIDQGTFDGFHVIARHHEHDELDITHYLSHHQIVSLEYEAQRHFMEMQVLRNEQDIINGIRHGDSHPVRLFTNLSVGLT